MSVQQNPDTPFRPLLLKGYLDAEAWLAAPLNGGDDAILTHVGQAAPVIRGLLGAYASVVNRCAEATQRVQILTAALSSGLPRCENDRWPEQLCHEGGTVFGRHHSPLCGRYVPNVEAYCGDCGVNHIYTEHKHWCPKAVSQ